MTKEIELITKILDWYNDENREFSIFEAEKLVKEYAKEKAVEFAIHYNGKDDRFAARYDYFLLPPEKRFGL